MTDTNKNLFYFLMFLAMAGWGASWVNAKVLSSYINEYELIFLRNFFTIASLVPVLIFTRKYFYINKRSFLLAILASVIMIAYMKCYFLGTKFGTASLGGALVTTLIPINTFLIMAFFYGKKIVKKDYFALAIGALGVMTMLNVWSFSSEQIFTIQNMYFLGASILWPALTITSSKITKTSPMVFTLYMYIITSIMVAVFFTESLEFNYSSYDTIFWINILGLAIVSTTFSTTVYFIGIEKLGTNEVSSFIFLVPLFAILFSIIFLKEHLSISLLIGTILTLIAVKILNNIKIFKKRGKVEH
ncbi:DMT family transporter [Arcobacter roscoffensis]|uniref:DMT family transporter n=1 Tax=Arcobacter roscoffensis TaxID=2961520 RepID=A0ABY5E4Z0_9BACT|nr:DMT family transporter [Arcobacter roscoffensis]UTJ07232.1 DMT family transporter [Arcobacter roscoffensis]